MFKIVNKPGYWISLLEQAYKNSKQALDKFCIELHRLVFVKVII